MGNGIVENLKFVWECILQVIYSDDEKCILCKSEIFDKECICLECKKRMKLCKDSFDIEFNKIKISAYSVSYYSGIMMELILKLKYKSNFKAGETIANYMISLIEENNIKFDFITYIPMNKVALKKRGYNQSKYLAQIISDALKIPIIHCLEKTQETKDQIGLNYSERWKNMCQCFKFVSNRVNIKNKKILIVDDVITTGATAFYCAYELIKNGSGKIIILTGAKSKV
ncbi:ComF family protein [Clostridium thailandense]|uniref:ComF family protein n=1 Tax=Clostridium thailandense TaxID=2794346 RepID=A0A949TTP7_9CLOT|nr:ComF family protein [Clostridium thailandense]MBV7272183.1 ComF family protein [Clostridium thailandense]MCH5135964.1 ComF family protein [Clostridiaceae bacterium UIB06]